jgi:5'-nucleotidase
MKSILLTNDDGIDAEGLKTLRDELRRIAHVLIVAPNRNRSAVSHGLTIHERLKFEEAGSDSFSLNGTPADCVIYALEKIFLNPPDLVISGINHGLNLGDDIMYSGTVAAAREASRHGVPAIAVSQDFEDGKKIKFKEGSEFIRDIVKTMLQKGLEGELLLNINIPTGKIKGVKITRQGCSEHRQHFNIPDAGRNISLNPGKKDLILDRLAISSGYVSITPLQRDQTDYAAAQSLKDAY